MFWRSLTSSGTDFQPEGQTFSGKESAGDAQSLDRVGKHANVVTEGESTFPDSMMSVTIPIGANQH